MVRNEKTPAGASSYTAVGVVFGAGVGLVAGVLIGGGAIALGMAVGGGVGVVIGAAMDARVNRPST